MTEYDEIYSHALKLPAADRLRLIDALAATVADDRLPTLSEAWLKEIERRSKKIGEGTVDTEPWEDVRRRLFEKHAVGS